MDENILNFDDIFDTWQPAWWQNTWVLLGVVCFAVVVVVIIFKMVQWYTLLEQKKDPRKWALKRLYAINPAIGLQTRYEFKYFYQETLATIKEYLAQRYGYQSESRTDSELLDYLKQQEVDSVDVRVGMFYKVVQRLVEHGLTVKFALAQGNSDQIKADYLIVMSLFSQEKM